MMSPERIVEALKVGLLFAKIGAKITESSQPLDLGEHFKILNMNGKLMTSDGIIKPLSKLVDIILKDLRIFNAGENAAKVMSKKDHC